MNTDTNQASSRKQIPLEDTLRQFTDGVAQVDPARAQAYGTLQTVRSAKDKQLSRQQKLLETKYGTGSPEVAAVKSKIAVNQYIRQDLSAAQAQAATPQPAVDKNSYVFHGFVRDSQLKPLPQLTVALFDATGSWARDFGYGCTDQNGHFELTYPQQGGATASDHDSDDRKTGAPLNDSRSLTVGISDAQQKLLYSDPTPLTPALGRVDYRVYSIADTASACTPPAG